MSNDSRDAFEEKYKADWDDPYMHIVREIWESAWQAAQSSHEAEREALATKIKSVLIGIDNTETEHELGWRETSVGAEFGKKKLNEILDLLSDSGSKG